MTVKHPDIMKVIINADDLGMDNMTNTLVFELMSAKKITSATIMANGVACEDAARSHGEFKNCSFGAHLTLTSGRPLSEKTELAAILDEDGQFHGLDFLLGVCFSPKLMKAIYLEFCLQIEKIQRLGIEISHIDSHQHIHNLPQILPIVKLIQRKYNIKRIRLTKNLYFPEDSRNLFRGIKKILFNYCLKHIYKSYTTDFFTAFDVFYKIGRATKINGKSAELMVHLRERKSGDYASLMHDWPSELIFPVEIISYQQLNGM